MFSGYRDYEYTNITKLFKDKKYNAVIRAASKYLQKFPDDYKVRFMRAKSYKFLEKFDSAIEDLKYNIGLGEKEYSLTELYFLYYFLNKYNEAIDLLPYVYESRYINAHSVSISELIMKTQLGIDMKVKKGDRCDYIRSQIFSYSTDMTLSHIQTHSAGNNTNKSLFNEGVDLSYLLRAVRNNIDNSKKVNTEEILEIHYFGISNIGYSGDNTCNFIKVVVVPNTNKVITMYPVYNVDCNYISDIEIDYDKLFERKVKVKTISKIDKFNQKYNRGV